MIAALVGAQFGSEGKGAIAARVARDFEVHVRVGAANAGHTVYTNTKLPGKKGPPEKHVLQQIPCAAYTNPEAILVIGAGAQISPHTLAAEIKQNAEWREALGYDRLLLFVDPRAHIVTEQHIEQEQDTDLAERIGSTSTKAREGIGAAAAAKVMREAGCVQFGAAIDFHAGLRRYAEVIVQDTTRYLNSRTHLDVLLEGTQGTGLSITTGMFPYCTSRNPTASGLAADCGIGPRDIDRVILVARTYPIRVAGNSGPFYPDSEEMTWRGLGLEPEITTVTKLERRVATFSMQQIVDAVGLNSADEIALTFCDYICPAVAGEDNQSLERFDNPMRELRGLPGFDALYEMTRQIEAATHCDVRYWGTGPHSVIDRYALPVENPTPTQHFDHLHMA